LWPPPTCHLRVSSWTCGIAHLWHNATFILWRDPTFNLWHNATFILAQCHLQCPIQLGTLPTCGAMPHSPCGAIANVRLGLSLSNCGAMPIFNSWLACHHWCCWQCHRLVPSTWRNATFNLWRGAGAMPSSTFGLPTLLLPAVKVLALLVLALLLAALVVLALLLLAVLNPTFNFCRNAILNSWLAHAHGASIPVAGTPAGSTRGASTPYAGTQWRNAILNSWCCWQCHRLLPSTWRNATSTLRRNVISDLGLPTLALPFCLQSRC
jgi:hypothetical protein